MTDRIVVDDDKLKVIVLSRDVDVFRLPVRPFDFNRGDRRFYERDQAIEHAIEREAETGLQQLIRPDRVFQDELWLVQSFQP